MQDLTAIEAEPTAHRTRRWTWAATARTLASLLLISLVLFLGFVAYGTVVNNRWYTIVAIEGGSMQPTINQGDAIVITRPPATIEEGMILTMSIEGHIVTHRVVTVNPDGSLVTKGDANDAVDEWSGFEVRVIGRYRGRIPLLGRTLPDRSGAWLLDRVEIYFSADPAPAAVPPTDPKHGIDVSRVTSTGSAVTKGCNPPTNDKYCPGSVVSRGQMAAFLARALGLPSVP
jgi:signal peptidase I